MFLLHHLQHDVELYESNNSYYQLQWLRFYDHLPILEKNLVKYNKFIKLPNQLGKGINDAICASSFVVFRERTNRKWERKFHIGNGHEWKRNCNESRIIAGGLMWLLRIRKHHACITCLHAERIILHRCLYKKNLLKINLKQ